MKRIILTIVFVLLVSTIAFAAQLEKGKSFTFTGKVKLDDDTSAYFVFDERNKVQGVFNEVDVNNNATSEFKKCLGDGKYKGVFEVTAIVDFKFKDERRGVSNGASLKIDKSSTCTRK